MNAQNKYKPMFGVNKTIFFVSGIVLLIATVFYYVRNPLITTVTINGKTFYTDVAVTNREKSIGLGGRTSLKTDHAMLFPFDHKERFSFWMKDMNFPIDIVWILDNQIVEISKNVPVPTSETLPVYSPSVPVNKVLEINAGLSDKYGFTSGDLVIIRTD